MQNKILKANFVYIMLTILLRPVIQAPCSVKNCISYYHEIAFHCDEGNTDESCYLARR